VLLSRGRHTWASHHAALALSGLPLVDCDLKRIDVCSPVDRAFTRTGLTTHPLSDGDEGRVVGERVVVEFDGLVKYDGADGRAALAREKAREDRLRAAGYQVVRLVWSDLRDPHRVATLVRQAAHRAGQGPMPR
jgi:hypothetical protein